MVLYFNFILYLFMNWIKNNILPHFKIAFFLLFPLFFTHSLAWFLKGVLFKTDVVENVLFAIIVFFLFSVFKTKKWARVFVFALYILALVIEFSYLYLFKSYINSSSFFILFQSNLSEISSFFIHFTDFWLVFTWFLLFAVFGFGVRYILNTANFSFLFKSKFSFILLSILMVLHFFSPLSKSNFYYNTVTGFLDYKKEKVAYDAVKFDKLSNAFSNVKHQNKEEICVLVIGESTSRNHMGIYGYSRNTTPKLKNLSNEIYAFKNVVSPHTHTLHALEKVLTLGNTQNEDNKFKGTLLQLFNAAGFKTYWLSNQPPSGLWDNFISGIASSAAEAKFINISNDKTPFDGDLLPYFDSVLKEQGTKKLIILHLMGTHFLYENRHPNSFTVFKDVPQSIFKSAEATKQINAYDNSVMYQDFVWSQIISQLKELDTNASAIFLSDHGEEVYQSIAYAGHAETKGSKNMYDIPFIVWLSPEKKKDVSHLVFDINRSFSSENLLFAMSDLANISFTEMQAELSVFNTAFKPQNRLIFNGQDYDAYFKE